MKKTLLLVFIHGFKGSDTTFRNFPHDLRALLSHALPKLDVQSVQYPQYETRGDLKECVAKFREWLQDRVIDIEVANGTPSPTVDPSVHVILCGHSMGGIVAAETVLSIARDEVVPGTYAHDTTNSTMVGFEAPKKKRDTNLLTAPEDPIPRPSSAPPPEVSKLFFPCVKAVLAFDTPYLGISPGVLAHGAEDHFNQASAAYKAYDTASSIFGWNSPRSASPAPIANAASRGLPAPPNGTSGGWSKWGTYAMYGGAAAALAGAAGAAYLNWNQIGQGLAWAGSHMEFVGCLARGAELQKRVEGVVELTRTHGLGFVDFYSALGEKVVKKTQYAGAVLGSDRTFCVVPRDAAKAQAQGSSMASKRSAPSFPAKDGEKPESKRRKTKEEENMQAEMREGEKVHQFAEDTSKSKGEWVKCVNAIAPDELRAHTSMFEPTRNPNYHSMLPLARDRVVGWIDRSWYEEADGVGGEGQKAIADVEQVMDDQDALGEEDIIEDIEQRMQDDEQSKDEDVPMADGEPPIREEEDVHGGAETKAL